MAGSMSTPVLITKLKYINTVLSRYKPKRLLQVHHGLKKWTLIAIFRYTRTDEESNTLRKYVYSYAYRLYCWQPEGSYMWMFWMPLHVIEE